MQDREIAYEQNVTGLEIAWRERIESFATHAVSILTKSYPDPEHNSGLDLEGLQLAASEAVSERLLNSERWANVNATDISDIAYEAVSREIDSRR